ncbi:MAG: hypothetical protein K0U78_06145 [Actinomycetia bacterium]|nr:hypothetical protein [Actinomycetes bacterium]
MLTGWLSAPRARGIAFVAGMLAALAMIVVGCTNVTNGDVQVAENEAPVYRASVSASIEESLASSSARESERQESLRNEAVQASCESMSSSSADAIGAVNAYVDAFNADPAEIEGTDGPAVDALNLSADAVAGSLSDPLDPALRDALNSWVEAARTVATAIAGNYGTEEFNNAITDLNESKTAALDLCDAAYR